MAFIIGVMNATGVILKVLVLSVIITEDMLVVIPYHYTKNTTAFAEPPATVPTLVGVMLLRTNLFVMVKS